MASRAWEARNARARALGYDSYYDYRAHSYGRRASSEPRATGPELSQLRGHRSDADFLKRLARGDVELVAGGVVRRNPRGQIVETQVMLVDAKGRESRYTLKKLSRPERERLSTSLAATGARVAGYLKSVLASPALEEAA